MRAAISKDQMTFVVCGKIVLHGEHNTKRALTSIHDHFPTSYIVLSTWQGEPLDDVAPLCDELVLSDPEAYAVPFDSLLDQTRKNTVNIQQITGTAGMSRVTTPWTAKTRTDFVLTGDGFYRFYVRWESALKTCDERYRVFKRRVLAPWIFTKDPETTAIAYQLSDFFQFGTTEDLRLLWDGHQEPDEVLNFFSENRDTAYTNPKRYNHLFDPEQCFFLHAIKKCGLELPLPRWYCDPDMGNHLPEIKKTYASNVLLATLHELQIDTRWKKEEALYKDGTLISAQRLFSWYLKYVDGENQACREFLALHPTPELERRSLTRKIRMILREIPFLREAYRSMRSRGE